VAPNPETLRALVGSPHSESDLRGPEIAAIDLNVALPIEVGGGEGELDEITHAVCLTRGDDIVVRLLLLQHQPHRLYIVADKAPITLRFEVP
jgi:hypothetical protein